MFGTVAWATDGSDACGAQLGRVTRLAGAAGATLWVIHAVTTVGGGGEAVVDRLKEHVRELRRAGSTGSLYVVRGVGVPVAEAIAAAARALEADLLVIGAGGATVAGVLAAAPCPVLVLTGAQVDAGTCGSSPVR